jgi:hypothetical protein
MLAHPLAARAAIRHGATGIEQQCTAEIRLFLVFPDVKSIGFSIKFPVNTPDFVSGNILSMLLELDTEALMWRPVQPCTKSLHHLPSKNLKVLKLGNVTGRQQLGYVGHLASKGLKAAGKKAGKKAGIDAGENVDFAKRPHATPESA